MTFSWKLVIKILIAIFYFIEIIVASFKLFCQ